LHCNRWFIAIACLLGCCSLAFAQEAKKSFTARDETELWSFIPGFDGSNVHFSPDKNYFVVYCQRGRLDIDRPEDSLRFYRADDVAVFLKRPDHAQSPAPVWVMNLSNDKEGPNIEGWSYRWLPDSSGVAFLERMPGGSQSLVIADPKLKKLISLTSADEDVQRFDVRDRSHYVYTAASLEAERDQGQTNAQSPVVVGTGQFLGHLLLPEDPVVKQYMSHRAYHLWAVIGGERFEVQHDGAPVDPGDDLALSPDGLSMVTELPVPDVPKAWETLYPPPFRAIIRIHAGNGSARQYVRLELKTGSVRSLTDAPVGFDAGWIAYGHPAWSSHGNAILLPNTFIKSKDALPSRPCIAVVDLATNATTCVDTLKSRTAIGVEEGFREIWAVEFSPDGQSVVVKFGDPEPTESVQYRRTPDGSWQLEQHRKDNREVGNDGLEVTIKQGINDPPLLMAYNGNTSRVIWDPNPQLKNIELSEATVYTWKDKDGREIQGGLYKPVHYKAGQRYPLVIQTHGFAGAGVFLPSGTGFPNEFAARQLAGAGFFVLQADDLARGCASANSEGEGPCAASTYEAAAKQLVADTLVDPNNIGLIGFSRSCFYVLETLTRSSYPFKAALIGDGVTYGYLEYVLWPSPLKTESVIGAAPFGVGLQKWFELSPGFNLDKVKPPVMVVAHGRISTLSMWEPYALLYSMKKPVDLVMLKTDEHVVTNPVERVASQTLSVDWFRFWLQGYEDPDPAKTEQYRRWHELKKMQAENERRLGSTPPASE
jgi:dipeptidyl aminopeptidase/acylaminoacyl peptidase